MAKRLLPIAVALCAALCAAAPARAAEPGAGAPVSSAAMLYVCCTPAPLQERYLAEAKASGAEFVRVDVGLSAIFEGADSRERPDWSGLDKTIELARRNDVKLLGIVLDTPAWLSDCPERTAVVSRCAARDPAEFGRLAGEVAAHASGQIGHWEILNEPDANWAFKGSPEDYARMLSAAYDAIKARVPEAQVLFGGVERPREHEWVRRVFATPGADAARKFDIAAVHLRLRLRNELRELPRWLTEWRALLAEHGFEGPVWVTEHGYPADPSHQWDPAYRGGDAGQAALLRDSLPLLAGAGASQIFVTLRDNLFGEFLSEGIVHIDEAQPGYPTTRRPSFGVVSELARRWAEGRAPPAGSGPHEELRRLFERLARASWAAGRPVAAALQEGAARGHALLAAG
ncbi:MAG: polysaccharide biosynthesis protein PslG [Thermoleophilaceae bacterium]|jgi:hypothetical protein|nr:polysaccharide biosynthesis protein PslG [Thermoleophilaceae bacterium]